MPRTTALRRHAATTIGPSKRSPMTKRRPAKRPPVSSAVSARRPARTIEAMIRNDRTYEQPSTTSTGAGLAARGRGDERAAGRVRAAVAAVPPPRARGGDQNAREDRAEDLRDLLR